MKCLFAPIFFLLLVACSGDNATAPPNDDDGNNGGGGTLTREDTLRVLTLSDVAEHLDGWWSEGPDTVAARTLAYLNTIPMFEEVGRSGPTGVWARFDDGRLLIIPNNLQPGAPEDTLELLSGESPVALAPAGTPRTKIIDAGRKAMRALRVPTSGLELPKSRQFRVWDGINGCYLTPRNRIRALLREGGYVEAPALSPTVDGFLKVRGDGVFVLFSHGDAGQLKDRSNVYAVWTSTNVGYPEEALYDAYFDSHELAYMIMPGRDAQGGCSTVTNYGITATFVARRMSFTENSLVYLNVCQSGSAAAGDFRQALANAGASVVVGWDGNVSVGTTFKTLPYLIDRLLGANEVQPRENPKQRAFNIYDVRDNMAAVGRVTEPLTGATLEVFRLSGDFGLLAPTIQFLSIDDDGQQPRLIIAGLFGTDPGEGKRSVTINGTELENILWNPTEIDCDIPESGGNAFGTVVVKVGSGQGARESNPVNITQWEGELTYERDDPGDQTATMKIKFRILADIHDFRDEPGEPPFKTQVLFGPRGGDTSVHVTTGGKYAETIGDCTETWTFGQGGDLVTPFEGTPNGAWMYFGSVDTESHTLQLNMAVLTVFDAGTWVATGPPGACDTFSRPYYVTVSIEDCLYDDIVQTAAFRMQMGDDFVVLEDQRGPCTVDPLVSQLSDDHQAQAKIRWGTMTPLSLPDPDAAR